MGSSSSDFAVRKVNESLYWVLYLTDKLILLAANFSFLHYIDVTNKYI